MSNFLKNQKAVVVFSGGQDSTTCLGYALKTFDEVVAISFDYGQKHSVELEQAKKICRMLDVEHHILDVDLLSQLAPNALTRVDIEVCSYNDIEEGKEPNTVVRGRNGLFSWLAGIFGSTHNIENIILGTCEADFSGYIDCRDTFIKSLQTAMSLGIDDRLKIHTPLMFLNKEETWELSYTCGIFDVVLEESHTCYNGDRTSLLGCKECPACKLRNDSLKSFAEKKGINLEEIYGDLWS